MLHVLIVVFVLTIKCPVKPLKRRGIADIRILNDRKQIYQSLKFTFRNTSVHEQ